MRQKTSGYTGVADNASFHLRRVGRPRKESKTESDR